MTSDPQNMLSIGFIDFEDDEKDLNLAFAIYDAGEYIGTLMLARSIFDVVLDDSERGVQLSYEDHTDDSEYPILLQEVTIEQRVIDVVARNYRFTLDTSKLDQTDFDTVVKLLKKQNHDERFTLNIS